jgi:diaminopimelate decarboxylase
MPGMGPSLTAAARRVAARLGTPFHLYDLPRLRADAEAVRSAFPDPWLRLYALKANALPGLVREVAGLGYGAAAASRGELALAGRAGFEPAMTTLLGVGKSRRDLAAVVRAARDGRPYLWTSLESAEESAALSRMAARAGLGAPLDVLVRVNPQSQPETHRGLAVGVAESKFGVLAAELPEIIAAGGGAGGPLRWRGIHVHVGSQLGALDAWRSAFRVALRLLALQQAALPDFDTLDAGSGFPVAYGEPGSVPAVAHFAREAREELGRFSGPEPRLAVEPGRAVVAGCGWLVARVLHARDRADRGVVLDAGMTELIRPALYGVEHPVVALTSRGRPVDPAGPPAAPGAWADGGRSGGDGFVPTRLHGPTCEATDALGTAALPPLRRDDIVAIGMTGAYGSSMASAYNGRPRAAELAWDGERVVPLRRRGSLASLP